MPSHDGCGTIGLAFQGGWDGYFSKDRFWRLSRFCLAGIFPDVERLNTFERASVGSAGANVITFMIAIGLSIPAVALFAFGQVVGDVRIMRNNAQLQSEHLRAMRAYYEPNSR